MTGEGYRGERETGMRQGCKGEERGNEGNRGREGKEEEEKKGGTEKGCGM